MNVLSLFDGMSCGQVALERAGIKVDNYFASEIDKYAITIAQKNYPDTIQLGDALNWKEWDIDWSGINLILAGFPCQSWSLAGKGGGANDPRGQLMFTMLDILAHVRIFNPDVKFLFENVKMKGEFLAFVNSHIGVEPILINSALVSAQNRNRYYWTNVEGVDQPEDKGLLLKSAIEDGVTDRDKSYCLDANYAKGTNIRQYLEKSRRQIIFKEKSNCVRSSGRMSPITGRHVWDYPYKVDKTLPEEVNKFLGARRLTPIECERLQTLPDNYTEGVSNTQRYKMIGNGWTVDVIVHILKNLSTSTETQVKTINI